MIEEATSDQSRTQRWLMVGGLGILLLVALGWYALRSLAVAPEPGPTPSMASEHARSGRTSLSEGSTTSQGSVKARLVFTQVRSFAPA